jgi:hypothetical protein
MSYYFACSCGGWGRGTHRGGLEAVVSVSHSGPEHTVSWGTLEDE